MFSVSSATIQRIAEEQAGFAVMMTYVMLARGAGNNGTLRMSSYTAQNISSRTQLEHARIEEAVRWLTDKKIIAVPQEHHEHFKWVMQDDQQDIYLPASLTDSKHQAPPMMRLFDPQAQASVDKLVVLLTLYMYQDMEKCGGIDPRAGLYRHWRLAKEAIQHPVTNIVGADAAMFEVHGATEIAFMRFADIALHYIIDPVIREERFLQTFDRLKQAGFMYEIVQIWDSDPNDTDGFEAKPLYTHYVHDQIARGKEPFMQKEIQRVAYRLGIRDGYKEFTEEEYNRADMVKIRFVADKQVGGYPMGIFRLRYRHKSAQESMLADGESKRANAWLREMQHAYHQHP
jgi:hypothetical protein